LKGCPSVNLMCCGVCGNTSVLYSHIPQQHGTQTARLGTSTHLYRHFMLSAVVQLCSCTTQQRGSSSCWFAGACPAQGPEAVGLMLCWGPSARHLGVNSHAMPCLQQAVCECDRACVCTHVRPQHWSPGSSSSGCSGAPVSGCGGTFRHGGKVSLSGMSAVHRCTWHVHRQNHCSSFDTVVTSHTALHTS
jgi:hypothetical protein